MSTSHTQALTVGSAVPRQTNQAITGSAMAAQRAMLVPCPLLSLLATPVGLDVYARIDAALARAGLARPHS